MVFMVLIVVGFEWSDRIIVLLVKVNIVLLSGLWVFYDLLFFFSKLYFVF